jgi:hypothetical protein
MPAGRCTSLGLAVAFTLASWSAAADSSSLDQALEKSKATGLPILAVAGSKT